MERRKRVGKKDFDDYLYSYMMDVERRGEKREREKCRNVGFSITKQ